MRILCGSFARYRWVGPRFTSCALCSSVLYILLEDHILCCDLPLHTPPWIYMMQKQPWHSWGLSHRENLPVLCFTFSLGVWVDRSNVPHSPSLFSVCNVLLHSITFTSQVSRGSVWVNLGNPSWEFLWHAIIKRNGSSGKPNSGALFTNRRSETISTLQIYEINLGVSHRHDIRESRNFLPHLEKFRFSSRKTPWHWD